MRIRESKDRHPIVMLSRHVPDATGPADRARAWQMLRRLTRCHDVWLACVEDGPIHLAQWQAIDALTKRCVIQPRSLSRRSPARALAPIVREWAADMTFTAAFCADASLWPLMSDINVDCRACDLALRPSDIESRRASAWRLQRANRTEWLREIERHAAHDANVLTIGRFNDDAARINRNGRVMVVPPALDLESIAARCAAASRDDDEGDSSPRIIVHGDWRHEGSHRWRDWFRRAVWPQVREAVPQVAWADTTRTSVLELSPPREDEGAIVVCTGDAGDSQSILHAMALKLACVADQAEAERWGASHGQHVLAAQTEGDWAAHCIDLLRDESARRRLGREAKTLVESRHALDPADALWLGDVAPVVTTAAPMADDTDRPRAIAA